ncbi:hypothetical protein [Enterococcus termitis]|uniref:Uncharacterized protein n=1 Tax=Enterococcus termitis TaxID=332950 RepID=A0A1E5GPG4_9ENTE|nr:hypothetical protein [Enterococcus termitis]OEG14569.1 hypothetical protein BCR25_19255 [Enterococcus termitis]OJG93878.1 hypothetical protein RV18_GL003429 [Enterococcus termitis]
MIVEMTADDIKKIGVALSTEMIRTIDHIWSGAFGISNTSDPIEILRTLIRISHDDNSSDGAMADSFAAFLEVESYGLLYKKLLTGNNYEDYLENDTLEEFWA